jgi:hypothetical protein
MRKWLVIIFISISVLHAYSQSQDSISNPRTRSLLSKIASPFVKLFSEVDTTYIEANHYKFQTMLQNIYSYEVYRLTDNNGNSIKFVPKPSLKIGPYAGWSLIFLGVSVDVLHLNDGNKRREWDVSLYTLPIGIDIYYRKNGDNYLLQSVNLHNIEDTKAIENKTFNGIESSVTGADLYYIFNHKKFSYPAAFNQSTQQKISCGSALAGIGFTRHSLSIDWQMLNYLFKRTLNQSLFGNFDEEPLSEKVTYTDLSVSGGYGYNWVFAENWLLASSVSLALSRKQSVADSERGFKALGTTISHLRDFKFSDITLDAVGRFGIVWNNGRMFAGASAIVHSYNYSKSNFYTNNIFGSFNAYFGINLGLKKKYRK